jgi:hypothetical protein
VIVFEPPVTPAVVDPFRNLSVRFGTFVAPPNAVANFGYVAAENDAPLHSSQPVGTDVPACAMIVPTGTNVATSVSSAVANAEMSRGTFGVSLVVGYG